MRHAQASQENEALLPRKQSRAVVRRTIALASVSSVADVAAVAQLVTTGSGTGVLVASLLSVLAGFLGILQLSGRPVGGRTFAMALLIAIGSGTSGAVLYGYWTSGAVKGDMTAGTTTSTIRQGESTSSVSTTGASLITAAPSTTEASSGAVLRTDTASLRDHDYLDVETGAIGEVRPNTSDLWYVGDYRELWTAGGGELPITPVEFQPDFIACSRELAKKSYDYVPVGDLRLGEWVCVQTAERNLVAVHVNAVPGKDEALSISYTVWHK
jgi:hypothetical protein